MPSSKSAPPPSAATDPGTFERVLGSAGIHNFRDYGGYAVAGGGHLRTDRLFRSAQHLDATDTDLDMVTSLGFAAIIDLRGDGERERAPCRRPENYAVPVLFSAGETTGLPPHWAAAEGAATAEMARARLRSSYQGMAFRPRLVEIFTRYFDTLADVDGPTLVHCLAGKDRTGLIVAMLHRLTGVHPDDMLADYLLTNSAGDVEARIDAGLRGMSPRIRALLSPEASRELMAVRPEYLELAFGAIDERCGSFDRYAEEVLDVTPEKQARIVEKLVA